MVRKFTTPVELPADPSSALQAATKQYADAQALAAVVGYARMQVPTTTKTAAYTAAINDLVMVDSSAGPITITLPVIGTQTGRISVKNLGGTNIVTVAAGVGNTIGSAAAASVPIRYADQVTTLQANGTNWVIPFNHFPPTVLSTYAPLASPTFTGTVTLPADPTSTLQAATKQYVDAHSGANIQVFATPGTFTWTKPTNAVNVHILCIGGGGGGASGARAASGTAAAGGAGGGGGGWSEMFVAASQLTASETVLVGAGGTGGAAVTSGTASTAGGTGGATAVYDAATINRTVAIGGSGGSGTVGGAGGNGVKSLGSAGGSGVSGAAGSVGGGTSSAPTWGGAGGGAGGGMSTTPATVFSGGAGGYAANSGSAGGTAGTSGTRTGGAGFSSPANYPSPGSGGGGGAGAGNVVGGAGGAGGTWGAGGGGGGATVSTLTSGAGGNGGGGLVIITTWF